MTTTSVTGLIDDLFRHETGRLISVLTRIFGPENLEMAEDVVQDSMIEALHQWSERGVPGNPSGWLFRVAKNKALNIQTQIFLRCDPFFTFGMDSGTRTQSYFF